MFNRGSLFLILFVFYKNTLPELPPANLGSCLNKDSHSNVLAVLTTYCYPLKLTELVSGYLNQRDVVLNPLSGRFFTSATVLRLGTAPVQLHLTGTMGSDGIGHPDPIKGSSKALISTLRHLQIKSVCKHCNLSK